MNEIIVMFLVAGYFVFKALTVLVPAICMLYFGSVLFNALKK